ncbi:MAG: hypothetical protein ACTSXW_03675 [Candidatus Baldrarchaeia archaeon]
MILTTLTFIFQPAAASKLYDEKTVVKGGYWSGYRLTGTVRGYFDPEIGAVYYVSSQHYAKAEEYGAFGWLWDVCWVKVWGEAYWQGQRIKNRDIKKYAYPPDEYVDAELWLSFDKADKVCTRVRACYDDGWEYHYFEIKFEELTICV